MDWIDVDPKTVLNKRRREKSAKQFLREMKIGKAVPVSQLLHSVSTLQSMACEVRSEPGYEDALWRAFEHDNGLKYFMRAQ